MLTTPIRFCYFSCNLAFGVRSFSLSVPYQPQQQTKIQPVNPEPPGLLSYWYLLDPLLFFITMFKHKTQWSYFFTETSVKGLEIFVVQTAMLSSMPVSISEGYPELHPS